MRKFLLVTFVIVIQIIRTYSYDLVSELDEQHDFQVPLHSPVQSYNKRPAVHRRLIGKLLTAVKEVHPLRSENLNTVITGPELLAVRDALFDDQYKPWGAASLPNQSQNQVILDKVDDELFTTHSERHSYDERRSRDENDPL